MTKCKICSKIMYNNNSGLIRYGYCRSCNGLSKQKNVFDKKFSDEKRRCELCSCLERFDNIILSYDNGLKMCDDCALNYYDDFYE